MYLGHLREEKNKNKLEFQSGKQAGIHLKDLFVISDPVRVGLLKLLKDWILRGEPVLLPSGFRA